MNLPPLANFYAVRETSPRRRQDLLDAFESFGDFARVEQFDGDWICGITPLPGTGIADDLLRGGFIFAEGSEALIPAGDADSRGSRIRALSDRVDREPETLGRLPGDFTFVHLRPDGSATGVRSVGGLAPLFHADLGGGRAALGTRVRYFARYADLTDLDWFVLAIWTTAWTAFPDGRTFLEGCRVVDVGHAVTLKRTGSPRTHAYWSPWDRTSPREPADSEQQERAKQLGSILIRGLDRNLPDHQTALLALSGGVDSSAVGAVSASTLDRSVSTVTALLQQEDVRRHTLPYLKNLSEYAPFRSMAVIPIPPDNPNPLRRSAPRIITPVLATILCALPEIADETDATVFFGGQFADDVVGGHVTYPDWAAATPPWRLLQVSRNPEEFRDLARGPLWRYRNRIGVPLGPTSLPEIYSADIRSAWDQWRIDATKRFSGTPAARNSLRRAFVHHGWVTMTWEVASENGVRPFLPFVTRDVIEWSVEAHPRELIGPGLKKPLRRALEAHVPAMNLNRPKGGPAWDIEEWRRSVSLPRALDDRLQSVLSEDALNAERLGRDDVSRVAYLEMALEGVEVARRGALSRQPRPTILRSCAPGGGTS